MAQTKIIVDSNSYFRLAQNIHPLLCQPFGKENFTLYMHAELNAEFRGGGISTLELLKLMLEANHVDIEKVEQVVAQWSYEKDTPYNGWEVEYRALFRREPPKE